MTPLPEIHVNPKTISVLESLGVNARWLMENSAVTQRAYAEMMAERGASPDGDRAAVLRTQPRAASSQSSIPSAGEL